MSQTNWKTLIDAATERTANQWAKDYTWILTDEEKTVLRHVTKLPNELLLRALDALQFECGNRCSDLNPCNAKETLIEIRQVLEGKK